MPPPIRSHWSTTTHRSTSVAVELAEILADAIGADALELRDARLIAQTRIAGAPVTDIASRSHLGSRTLWTAANTPNSALAASGPALITGESRRHHDEAGMDADPR